MVSSLMLSSGNVLAWVRALIPAPSGTPTPSVDGRKHLRDDGVPAQCSAPNA
jgi:hypothetical protein